MILKPFESAPPFQVDADTSVKSQGILEVDWNVSGPLPNLCANRLKDRADRLWLDTVFEVFGRFGESDAYWETNLSPQGQWNAYSFSAYRQGMAQTEKVVVSQLEWLIQNERQWRFISRYRFEQRSEQLYLGLACIIYPGPYHFALAHSGSKPDFHARENFATKI